jgi:hypothetical protein
MCIRFHAVDLSETLVDKPVANNNLLLCVTFDPLLKTSDTIPLNVLISHVILASTHVIFSGVAIGFLSESVSC